MNSTFCLPACLAECNYARCRRTISVTVRYSRARCVTPVMSNSISLVKLHIRPRRRIASYIGLRGKNESLLGAASHLPVRDCRRCAVQQCAACAKFTKPAPEWVDSDTSAGTITNVSGFFVCSVLLVISQKKREDCR